MPSIDSESAEDARRVAEAQADAEQAEREAQVMYGHPVPAGPDADREARRAIYWDRERRRAVAALDRYLETVYGPGVADFSRVTAAAGDRFIQAVIDVVLAMVGPFSDRYGAPCATCGSMTDDHDAMAHDALSERMARSEAVCRTCGYAPLEEAGSCPDCAAAHRERVPEATAYQCWNCSFRTASSERFTGHLQATGHADDAKQKSGWPYDREGPAPVPRPTGEVGIHQKAGYGVTEIPACGEKWCCYEHRRANVPCPQGNVTVRISERETMRPDGTWTRGPVPEIARRTIGDFRCTVHSRRGCEQCMPERAQDDPQDASA